MNALDHTELPQWVVLLDAVGTDSDPCAQGGTRCGSSRVRLQGAAPDGPHPSGGRPQVCQLTTTGRMHMDVAELRGGGEVGEVCTHYIRKNNVSYLTRFSPVGAEPTSPTSPPARRSRVDPGREPLPSCHDDVLANDQRRWWPTRPWAPSNAVCPSSDISCHLKTGRSRTQQNAPTT